MKKLYYRLLYLLITKPYLHLAISILSILIIRIIFIQTVYAESWDWNPGRFLLSEPTTLPISETDKGIIQYPESIKGLANLLLSSEIYSSDVSSDTDSEESKSDSEESKSDRNSSSSNNSSSSDNSYSSDTDSDKSKSDSDTNSSDNETEISKNTEHYDYKRIIEDIQQIRNECKSKSQLVEQTIQYVKNIIPQDVLALNDEDMTKEDCLFRLYVEDFVSKSSASTAQEYFSQHLYLTALTTYNAINLTNEEVPQNIVEDTYFETLSKSLGDEKIVQSILKQLAKEEMLEKAKNFKRPSI